MRTRDDALLDALTGAEGIFVLRQLVTEDPELRGEAERIAAQRLSDVDRDGVADEVAEVYLGQSFLEIGSRAGRQPGGWYVHEADAQWELLEEALEPFTREVRRLAQLGFRTAAVEQAHRTILGLYRLREAAGEETLIGWGPSDEFALELARSVLHEARQAGIEIDLTELAPAWRPSLRL